MPPEKLQIAHPLGKQEPSVSLTLFILFISYYENPSGFFFLSHSNDSIYGRRRIKGILRTHSFPGILLQKPFEASCRSTFLVIDWLCKETKLVETPSIVRTLRGLLFQMQNFRSEVRPMSRYGKFAFVFSSFTFRFLSGSPLLSLFLPHFLFAGTLILMGKGLGKL